MKFLIAAAFALVLWAQVLPAWAAIAFVQSTNTIVCVACTSQAVAYTSNNSAGDLLIGCAVFDSARTVSSVTDTAGNTWQVAQVQNTSSGGARVEVWYAMNANAGANTPTVNYSGIIAFGAWMIHAYSGAAVAGALDVLAAQAQTDPGTGADAVTSGTNTTTQNNELIFGCTAEATGTGAVAPGTNFTQREDPTADSPTEDRILATAGSVAATFTTTDATAFYATVMATFKEFVASTGGSSQLTLTGVGD